MGWTSLASAARRWGRRSIWLRVSPDNSAARVSVLRPRPLLHPCPLSAPSLRTLCAGTGSYPPQGRGPEADLHSPSHTPTQALYAKSGYDEQTVLDNPKWLRGVGRQLRGRQVVMRKLLPPLIQPKEEGAAGIKQSAGASQGERGGQAGKGVYMWGDE